MCIVVAAGNEKQVKTVQDEPQRTTASARLLATPPQEQFILSKLIKLTTAPGGELSMLLLMNRCAPHVSHEAPAAFQTG